MRLLINVIVFIVIFNLVNSYNVFVFFPYPGKSHSILGEGFVRHLVNGGHNITYVTAIPIKNPPPNVRQIDVSSNFGKLSSIINEELDIEKIVKQESRFMDLSLGFEIMFNVSYDAVTHENVQRILMDPTEQFDVAIVEWLFSDLYSGLASVFGCPLIWSSSMEPNPFVMSLIGDLPNPAYSPNQMSPWTPPLTFVQRIKELWIVMFVTFVNWYNKGLLHRSFEEVYGPAFLKRVREIPIFEDVLYNASMMFGNSHVSQGFALSLPQNYIPIAGYHINDEVAPLPKNLQVILDSAKNGAIYFSLGTMMPAKTMPDELKRGLLKTFSKLKQTVIWKLEAPLNDIPSNVHIVDWAPQQSILAHPNTILFITHGGLLSTTETIHFGVPIIGIPLFGDQFVNMARAVAKGIGLTVDMSYELPDKLDNAIREIFGNSSYRERVKEISSLLHSRPMTPGQLINYWVDHVVQTKGAKYLRTLGLDVPLYQKLYLDFIAVITLSSILLYYSIKWLVRKVIAKLKRKLFEKKKIS